MSESGPLRIHLMTPSFREWRMPDGAWCLHEDTEPLCGRAFTQERVILREPLDVWGWAWGWPTCRRCARALAKEVGV